MRVDTQMRKTSRPWSKWKQTGKEINIELLFNDYWNSNNREFTVSSQSWPGNGPLISDRETVDVVAIGKHSVSLDLQFSTIPTVRLFATAHIRKLTVLA
jgi:hypothetical protein